MKVVVFNLGCKVNGYESDVILKDLIEKGYEVSDKLEYADAYIINTCAVTNEAERKSRQAVARALKYNPDAKIYICGCASEHDPKQFVRPNVERVAGVERKKDMTALEKHGIEITPTGKEYVEEGFAKPLRTRSYVKIQDGCNNFCSYCIIPYLRGRSRSRKVEDALAEIAYISDQAEEIILTGIDLSSYGKDIGTSLTEFVGELNAYKNRFRLGSLEVRVIDDNFLSTLTGLDRFCPQFHLSLQNGDNQILKDMNRHYTVEDYLARVELIRKYFPNASITTDVIVGFPTESEENFANTCNMVQQAQFANMHIFPYSKREGTVASKYKMLDKDIVASRVERLSAIRDKMKLEYESKAIGVECEVIFEQVEHGKLVGHNEYLVKIYADQIYELGKSYKVVPIAIYADGLII